MTVALTPELIQDLVKLRKLAQLYPDFPENFIPPAFTDPNYVPPFKSTGTALVVIGLVLSVTMLVVVPARLLVRIKFRRTVFGWDDILIIPAALLAIALNVFGIVKAYDKTIGYHSYDMSYEKLKTAYLWQFIHMQLYFWGSFFTKVSVLAFYMRLWPPGTGHTYLKAFMALLFCVNIVSVCLVTFNFRPIRAAWDLTVLLGPYSGGNFQKRLFVQSVVYAIIDLVIWAMPIPVIWRLRMSRQKRFSLIVLFSMGFLACATVIVQTPLVFHAFNTFDGSWYETDVALCNQLETGIAVIVTSLPALNAVTNNFISKLWENFSRRMRSAYSYLSSPQSRSSPTDGKVSVSAELEKHKEPKEEEETSESAKESTVFDSTISKSTEIYDSKFEDGDSCTHKYSHDLEAYPVQVNIHADRSEQLAGSRPSRERKNFFWPLTRHANTALEGNNQGSQMRNILDFTTRANSTFDEELETVRDSDTRLDSGEPNRGNGGNNARNILMFTTRANSPMTEGDLVSASEASGVESPGSTTRISSPSLLRAPGEQSMSVTGLGLDYGSQARANVSKANLPIESAVGKSGAGH